MPGLAGAPPRSGRPLCLLGELAAAAAWFHHGPRSLALPKCVCATAFRFALKAVAHGRRRRSLRWRRVPFSWWRPWSLRAAVEAACLAVHRLAMCSLGAGHKEVLVHIDRCCFSEDIISIDRSCHSVISHSRIRTSTVTLQRADAIRSRLALRGRRKLSSSVSNAQHCHARKRSESSVTSAGGNPTNNSSRRATLRRRRRTTGVWNLGSQETPQASRRGGRTAGNFVRVAGYCLVQGCLGCARIFFEPG
ncbi:hypothetical protein GQ55_2G397700 [Panicum hallii var. hallii]|uniref:Uncharacterized protein n=1 Tax=Panicum hallii var. hallii TaxID=1504633 RepID=A0A2T7EXC2_9POAL|nr:hypothetical protein GQ55_2G397700 [Panicum hallii var. hallii]